MYKIPIFGKISFFDQIFDLFLSKLYRFAIFRANYLTNDNLGVKKAILVVEQKCRGKTKKNTKKN